MFNYASSNGYPIVSMYISVLKCALCIYIHLFFIYCFWNGQKKNKQSKQNKIHVMWNIQWMWFNWKQYCLIDINQLLFFYFYLKKTNTQGFDIIDGIRNWIWNNEVIHFVLCKWMGWMSSMVSCRRMWNIVKSKY